ncbi:hypothetical protein RN001_013381 [Aquatica leii]|uniref:Protein sleepless n=1 Tax=Aquatica leii TaxID=1421715 RepID=A0AAN7S6Z8_9COLE|nr:hypothetical protein RN001_013381 [Aquatica leii]
MCTHHWLLLFVLVFLINHVGKGSALQCYTCKSAPGGLCGDPFNATSVTSSKCTLPDYLCLKQKQILKIDAKEIKEVSRSCVPSSYCRLMLFDHCSLCDTDYCNSSNVNLSTLSNLLVLQLCLKQFFN